MFSYDNSFLNCLKEFLLVIFFSAGDDILLERLSNQSLISDTALAGIVLKPVLIVKSQTYILIFQI